MSNNKTITERRIVAAKRADSWYADRIEKRFTLADNELCAEMYGSDLLIRGIKFDERQALIEEINYEAVVENSRRRFTLDLELSGEIRSSKNEWIQSLSPSHKDEYINPILDCLSKVEGFFDVIALQQRRGDYLPVDQVMDRIFLRTFSGVDGFVQFQKDYTLAVGLYNQVRRDAELIAFSECERSRIIEESLEKPKEYIARKIFADLAGRT